MSATGYSITVTSASPTLIFTAAGLLVAGLGFALLYPTTVSRVVAAWPQAPDRAAARAALASGLAIGGAPLLLAVPGLLFVLAIRAGKPDPGRSYE